MHITNEESTGSYMPFIVRFYISELNNEPPWGRFNKAGAHIAGSFAFPSLFLSLLLLPSKRGMVNHSKIQDPCVSG